MTKTQTANPTPTKEQILRHLRRSNEVAKRAVSMGHHPFGSILLGPDNETVLLEQCNIDPVNHAESTLARVAATNYPPEYLWGCTLYTSVEPCCMCAGTAYWANIGRVVFGMTEHDLLRETDNHVENPAMSMASRYVFNHCQKPVELERRRPVRPGGRRRPRGIGRRRPAGRLAAHRCDLQARSPAPSSPRPGTRPILTAACEQIGALGVRNLATLGGNVGGRFGDALMPLLALDAHAELADGEVLPLPVVLAQPRLPLILALRLPPAAPGAWTLYEKPGMRAAFTPSRLTLALHVATASGPDAGQGLPYGPLRGLRIAAAGAGLAARQAGGPD